MLIQFVSMIPALAAILLAIFVGVFILVKFLERISVFYPCKVVDLTPASEQMDYEDLYITTKDGIKINAWLVKANAHASTVIFAHGNAGTISDRIMKLKFFHEIGLNIIIFDYRGYGRSMGAPSEKGVYLDVAAVYDYIQARKDIDPARIIGYGTSLGGAVMIELATQRKLAGLIVESSFTSAKEMARMIYPFVPTILMSIKFDSVSKVSKINVPKLFLHSHEDEMIPFSMSQKLYEASAEPKEFIVTYGGHNEGALVSHPEIKHQLMRFLQKHLLL